MSAWLLTNLIAAAVLPPLVLVLVLASAAGLFLLKTRRRLAVLLLSFSTFALYALSTPWVGGVLQKSLEVSAPLRFDDLRRAEAIVVLGGGRRLDAAEYGGDTLTALSLERLRYAAWLHRQSGIPLLVTGGKPGGGTYSEGEIMLAILRDEYGLLPRWVETTSLTTWDNARFSAAMLRADGVKTIALVTHAWHLRRAIPLFEAQGLRVIPAGVQFADTRVDSVFSLLPSPAGLRDSTFALHEWLGILWYKLRSLNTEKAP
jgi:uncharacterized SAM-binding protein YcdF (DUF218 family)